MLTYQPNTPAAQTIRTAIKLKMVAWRRVVGLVVVGAGVDDAWNGIAGERCVAEIAEERRSWFVFGGRRPVRSFASPMLSTCVGFGGTTSSFQVNPR